MATRRILVNPKLKEKVRESLSAVLPITIIVLLISVVLVPMELGTVVMFLVGAAMLIIGMGFFQLGAETAMTPIGESVGTQMSKSKHIWIVVIVALLMGIIITVAEPDLHVLASQVPAIDDYVLILTVSVGVGISLVAAVVRIILKIDLSTILIIAYVIIFGLSIFVPDNFLAVAFDSGGVTTGPITVPFILAIGIGLAAMRGDKDAASDSFGLIALSSVGPILAVMILGCMYNPEGSSYSATEIAAVVTTQDVARELGFEVAAYAEEIAVSLLPIACVFVLLQVFTRRLSGRQVVRIVIGLVYTFIGLTLFLGGVDMGFAPVGALMGGELATSGWKWLLVPIGIAIGYFIVKAEPAIQVLNHQVEDVTSGTISAKSMNHCLQIGVSVSVGLAMTRVLTGISIYWIVIPGYIIALVLSRLVPKMFVGIAFDSGGVASGPMTATFLLPLCIGASEAIGGNVMTDAFGAVSLVAMTPLIAIQVMGLAYKFKSRRLDAEESGTLAHPPSAEEGPVETEDEIIELEDSSETEDEIIDLEGPGVLEDKILDLAESDEFEDEIIRLEGSDASADTVVELEERSE